MTGDARDDGPSGAEARASARSRGRSARPGSRSTAGSISTSRPASPRPRPSDGSSSCSTPRRRATPERSIRSRRACCRSLSARRPRPCRSFRTAPRLTDSACAGARKARPTTRKGRSSRARDRRPAPAEIEALLPRFVGVILQTPPTFSAIRIDGARAYDLAREGESFEIEPRPINVYRLDLMSAEPRRSRARGRMRQGRLRARDRARPRPRARLLRPCDRIAPDPRRPVSVDAAFRSIACPTTRT